MIELSINLDHIATIRNARGGTEPDPIFAAGIAINCGVDGITFHLREDRRHITDRDVRLFKQIIPIKLNFEMAATEEMQNILLQTNPYKVTLVPEKRQERTTEGGLNLERDSDFLTEYIKPIKSAGIKVFLFVDPEEKNIEYSKAIGADGIELHTGQYAEHFHDDNIREQEIKKLIDVANKAINSGLRVCAGHGLNYVNTPLLLKKLPFIEEVSIGHAIIARAVFVGLKQAIEDMLYIVKGL